MPSEAEVEVLNIEVSSEWNDTPRRGVKSLLKCLDKLKRIETDLSTEKFANMSGISNAMNKIHNAVKPLENANLKNVVNSLGRLPKVISGYDEDTSSFSNCMEDIKNGISKLNAENNVEDVSKKLRKLQKTLTSYKDIDNDAFANTISTMNNILPRIQLANTANDLTKPIALLKRLPKVLDEYNTLNLEGLKKAYSELAKMVNLMKELNNIPNMKDFIASVKQLSKIKEKNVQEQRKPEIPEAPDLSPSLSQNLTWLEKLKRKFQELPKVVKSSTDKSKTSLKGLGKVINTISNALTGMFKSLGRKLLSMVMYRVLSAMIRYVSKAVREGINNFYQYSKAAKGSFADAMDRIATSSLYVKNAFGSLVGQLIQRVAPYLEWVFDKIAACVNKMSEFYAKLTGAESWTRAKKVPIEFAEATENAVNSTEKLKRAILGFDKLNILDFGTQLEKASKAKAPTVSKQYSMMFEEVKIVDNGSIGGTNSKFSKLGQSIKDCKEEMKKFLDKLFTPENKETALKIATDTCDTLVIALKNVVHWLDKLEIPEKFAMELKNLALIVETINKLLKTGKVPLKDFGGEYARLDDLIEKYNLFGTKEKKWDWVTRSIIDEALKAVEEGASEKKIKKYNDKLAERIKYADINVTVPAIDISPEALASGSAQTDLSNSYQNDNKKQSFTVNVDAKFGAGNFTNGFARQEAISGKLLFE